MRISKLKFIFLQSWSMIRNDKTSYLSLFFANIIGLTLPLLMLGLTTITYGLYEEGIVNIENIAQITLKIDEYDYNFEKIGNKVDELEYYCNVSKFMTEIYSEYGFTTAIAQIVNNNYHKFFSSKYIQGDFFQEEEFLKSKLVCVITEDLAKKLFDNTNFLGKNIYIEGLQFIIRGVITDSGLISNRVIIPEHVIKKHKERNLEETKYVLRFISGFDRHKVQDQITKILEADEIKYTFVWLSDYYGKSFDRTSKTLFLMIGISFILTIFVIINLKNVISVLFDIEKKIIGLKYAIGVSWKSLFIEKTLTYVIVSTFSLVVVLIFLSLTVFCVEKGIITKLLIKWYVFLIPAFSILMIISVIEAFFLMRWVFSMNAVKLLKD